MPTTNQSNAPGPGVVDLSKSLLESIVESAPAAMVLSDELGVIQLVNREVELLFGYSRDELVGQKVEMLVPRASRRAHESLRNGFISHPSVRRMGAGRDLHGLRKDGVEVQLEVGLNPIPTEQGLRILVGMVDVTERKRLEADIRRANEELERRVRDRTAELVAANREKELLLIDLQAQRAELERLSREDPLTELANRRDFDHRLDAEIQRAQRQGSPLTVAMLDLDRFKRVNDRYGHAIGDTVLREVACLIRNQCRAIDVIGRYGGEEFALALPGADARAASILCERIRIAFEEFAWPRLQPGLAVTVSAGVGTWRPGMTALALLALADAKLYEAKRRGRNRTFPAVARAAGTSPTEARPPVDADQCPPGDTL